MILIISERDDLSTFEVVDWLDKYGCDYEIILDDQKWDLHQFEIDNNNFIFSISNGEKIISLDQISSFWYRRGEINLENFKRHHFLQNNDENLKTALSHIDSERAVLLEFMYLMLGSKPGISSIFSRAINKLQCLIKAKEAGIKIPDSTILTKKNTLKTYFESNSTIITKAIQDAPNFYIDNNVITYYTEEVKQSMIDDYKSESFSPSFFQENIKKDYELRIFYLNEKCFSMAIFSQDSEQTKVDFRKYKSKDPNRTVPIKIESEIEKKIVKMMKSLRLNHGSIDLIRDTQGDYYFLEVNPIGQFGMVSTPCNFNLEKEIAITLKKYEDEYISKH